MKKLIVAIVLVLLIPIIFALIIKRIPPSMVGVKQSMWGGGIKEADYPTGFHLGIAGYHKWYLMSAKTHFIHFTKSSQPSARSSETNSQNPPLNVRTRDNNVVTIDVSVAYRIAPGEAHMIVQKGLQMSYPDRVKQKVLGALRAQLSTLSSEDLQSTETRLAKVKDALPVLDAALAEFSCEAESILIRRFSFEPQYEVKLQEKQFLRQKANLDTALTLEAEEQKTVNLIERQIQAAVLQKEQEWEKRIQEKKSEYEILVAEIRAEAKIYEQRTMAEGESGRVIAEANGQLAVEKSEALRNQLRTAALNSEGGSILLALEAAENLQMPSVVLNSDDPAVPMILDLSQLTKLLIGVAP